MGIGINALPELTQWDRWVAEHAYLEGRNLQPWRAILAVARWLDEKGGDGLFEKMNSLSLHYHQVERRELRIPDLSVLVVRTLIETVRVKLGIRDIKGIWDADIPDGKEFDFETKSLTNSAIRLINEYELEFDPEKITSRRVGRILGKMRLKKAKPPVYNTVERNGSRCSTLGANLRDLQR